MCAPVHAWSVLSTRGEAPIHEEGTDDVVIADVARFELFAVPGSLLSHDTS
jgi:hypothetical protein